MQDTEANDHSVDQEGGQSGLQALFTEVTALAHQLQKKALMAHEEGDSRIAAWGVLEILDRLGPQTVPGMARIRGLSRQSIQIQVNRLRAEGCVELAPNPAHKRSGLVQLTDPGRRVLAGVAERNASALEALLPYVPEARLLPTTRLLRQIREMLAGKEVRRAEAGGGHPRRKRRSAQARPARARKAAPAATPPPPPLPEVSEPDVEEFPVSLL